MPCLSAQSLSIETYNGQLVSAHEVIVKFKPGIASTLFQVASAVNSDAMRKMGDASQNAFVIHSPTQAVTTMIELLSQRTDLFYVQPNYILKFSEVHGYGAQ